MSIRSLPADFFLRALGHVFHRLVHGMAGIEAVRQLEDGYMAFAAAADEGKR
jgi:hypothetical protein